MMVASLPRQYEEHLTQSYYWMDELEKAHGDVLNIPLQIMEDGILIDGKGCTVNFKYTVLVMTSNVGSKSILDVANKYNGLNAGGVSTDASPA